MDDLFFVIFLLSLFAIMIFGIMALIRYAKKDSTKGKKQLKSAGISAAVMMVSFIAFVMTAESTETTSEEKTEVSTSKDEEKTKVEKSKEEEPKEVEETAEEKAAREAEEAKAAEEKAANKLAEEKEYYLNEVKTQVDAQLGVYDQVWNDVWRPTFEGISNGTVNVYTAYDNAKAVENQYNALYSTFGDIPDKGLSKENKKLLSEFKSKMKSAAMWRGSAAERAQEMFDEGDYSPSSMEKLQADVGYADSEMMTAVLSLTSLETNLGVDRGE